MQKIKLQLGKNLTEYEVGDVAYIAQNKPITLSSGQSLRNIPVAFQTYGTLNQDKSNAILLFHALTGDQYVATKNPVTGKDGWWNFMVGPAKPIDTTNYFVICCNVLGGCMGSVGPISMNQETGARYNLDFPIFTISDMVKIQKRFIDEYFGIPKLFGIIGGSMGGMLVLEWLAKYPDSTNFAIPMATAAKHSPQNIAFNEVARQAIMADPNWHEGRYIEVGKFPEKGLALARMSAHITYLSEEALSQKFGRNLQSASKLSFRFGIDFKVESYLLHQGVRFVDRFDPNSYLYLTKAMDYFDQIAEGDGNLSNIYLASQNVKVCTISFSDDWLFPPKEMQLITKALMRSGVNTSSVNIISDRGHDSFLLPHDDFQRLLANFIKANYEQCVRI